MPNYRGNTADYHRRQSCNPTPIPYVNHTNAEPCCTHDDALDGFALAMAYVPWQDWKQTYHLDKALCRGTIFPELDKPFCRIGGNNR